MRRVPPRSTLTDTPFPYTPLVRSISTPALLGQVLELRARAQTSGAIRALLALTPPQAHRLDAGDQEHDVALEDVRVGDRLRVRPGEKMPVDGVVLDGSRSEEHTSELPPLMRTSSSGFRWTQKKRHTT